MPPDHRPWLLMLADALTAGEPVVPESDEGTRPLQQKRLSIVEACITLGIILVSVGSVGWFTRGNYFFQDDFVFIKQAQRQKSLSITYLRLPLFQHFSPVSRLGDFVLAHDFGAKYGWARAAILAMVVLAVIAFAWTIRSVVAAPWRYILVIIFGESLALVHLAGWWTAALNIMPATILGLAAIGAYMRFRQGFGRRFGVLTVLFYGLSLFTHEQSWLVFGYLALWELLLFSWPGGPIRVAGVRRWRSRDVWWVWASLSILTGVAIANYMAFYYGEVKPRPTVAEMMQFVGILFGQSFSPSLTGFRPLEGGVVLTGAYVFDCALVCAVIAGTSIAFRGAWRAWVVFLGGFIANALMVGLNRVGYFGPDFGRSMYYVQAPAYLFALCLGASIALGEYRFARPGGTRFRQPRGSCWLYRRRILPVVAAMILLLFELGFFTSALAQESHGMTDIMARTSREYFTHLKESLRKAGAGALVAGGVVPEGIVASAFAPFNQLSMAASVANVRIHIVLPSVATAEVGTNGYLTPINRKPAR